MNVPQQAPESPRPALRALAWALSATALALVFAAYTRPDFMVMLADMVWSCF